MRAFWRILSFFEQWAAEVFHRPMLLFTLVIAPFLVLLIFGTGVELGGPKPRTIIVQPPDVDYDVEPIVNSLEQYVDFVGFEESLPLARAALERGDIDAVVVVPRTVQGHLQAGNQVPLEVLIGEVDPVRRSYARTFLMDQVGELNRQAIREAVGQAQADAPNLGLMVEQARGYLDLMEQARGDVEDMRTQVAELQALLGPAADSVDLISNRASGVALLIPGLGGSVDDLQRLSATLQSLQADVAEIQQRLDGDGEALLPTEAEVAEMRASLEEIEQLALPFTGTSPEVIAEPFELILQDVTPIEPTFTAFYSPGVVALLIQHLAITLGALAIAESRLLRVTDMLRVSPMRAWEALAGNYISYGVLCAVAAGFLLTALTLILDIPVAGSWAVVAGTLALLIACSLGVGFVIALVSSSTQQATQLSMLVLLASIFFSGFAFDLEQLVAPARWLAYAFPATYGIQLLQDEMLRGLTRSPEALAILGGGAVAAFALAWTLMRREFQPD